MFVQRRYGLSPATASDLNVHWKHRQLMQNLSLINTNFRNTMDPFCTSCGYDLIDNYNQRVSEHGNCPVDNVSGYTIKQLESSLYGATNWTKWRDNIKSQHNNATSVNVDELFANWN